MELLLFLVVLAAAGVVLAIGLAALVALAWLSQYVALAIWAASGAALWDAMKHRRAARSAGRAHGSLWFHLCAVTRDTLAYVRSGARPAP